MSDPQATAGLVADTGYESAGLAGAGTLVGGCDAKLASKLIFATLIISSITIVAMFGVLVGG